METPISFRSSSTVSDFQPISVFVQSPANHLSGIGGFYKSHYDGFDMKHEVALRHENRIATTLYYVRKQKAKKAAKVVKNFVVSAHRRRKGRLDRFSILEAEN